VKFLADMRVSQTTVRVLCEHGREVISLREQQLGRLHDTDILDKAKSEGCVVLTFDLDFGDLLAATIQLLPSMVIFRLHNQPPQLVTTRLLEIITSCREDLSEAAVVIVEHTRYRVRRLPI
jgi:predicted nuclease of predicted toxin-antitoxin system